MSDNRRVNYVGANFIAGPLAAIISYAINKSVGWAIFHWLVGFVYIVYAIIARGKEIVPGLKSLFY